MRLRLHKNTKKAVLLVAGLLIISVSLLKVVSVWDNSYREVESNQITDTATQTDTGSIAPDVIVRDPSEIELKDLFSGALSREDLIQVLVREAVVKPNTEQSSDSIEKEQVQQPVKSDYERRMAELIAEAYILRDEYTMALENMYGEAEVTLTAYVNESRSGEEITSLIGSYLSRASAMEAECDGKIDGIVYEMNGLIEKNNGDMTLVDTLVETYVNEKATKQAWYISRLQEKGLIVQ